MPRRAKRSAPDTVRVTVSLSAEQHRLVSHRAEKLKVSIGWVVRDAVEKYLERDLPLFAGRDDER